MKKILSATLGALLLVTAATGAASARPWHGHGGYGYHGYRHGDGGVVLGAGLGLFALAAILSNQQQAPRYADYGPPPPPPAYDRGYDDRGYGDYGGAD